MNVLGNSFYGYQIIDRSRHTTQYFNDKKTQKEIKEPFYEKMIKVEVDLYEVDMLKSTTQQ